MKNKKVIISYNGSRYHGFQKQDNAVTIQGVIEEAFSKIVGKVKVIGCSRTDAGVHANEFCLNFFTGSPIPNEGFIRAANTVLPRDIAVHSCEDIGDDFNARFSAKSKEYLYLIHCGKIRDVFRAGASFHYPYKLDLNKVRTAASLFVGEHDFSAYCKAESLEVVKTKKHGSVRLIHSLDINEHGDYIKIFIKGNGFLHNMVRIIVGTLIYVSEGKRTLSDVELSFEIGSKREIAGITLPPDGLYLNKVFY